VRVEVRVTPKAGRDHFLGIGAEPDGANVLRIAIAAPAAEGRANEALLRFLAKEWDVPKSALEFVTGATGRRKALKIEGDPVRIVRLIADWAARHG
jgi:uncharacterized protein (TIGR00251 family)